ncbi:GpE family phage tail protein [Endozoicomonas montiporae]|uniref:GpE family phage tail protein n=1 Tax=Endozoicomonas montiporae TaxID=1027273 RepID=UPI0009E35022|nr:GpE family phage tail protein [Endozoicomonas montiporae]
MEVEADIFIIFTGWNPDNTGNMSIPELMRWHSIALKRHEKAQQQAKQQREQQSKR